MLHKHEQYGVLSLIRIETSNVFHGVTKQPTSQQGEASYKFDRLIADIKVDFHKPCDITLWYTGHTHMVLT